MNEEWSVPIAPMRAAQAGPTENRPAKAGADPPPARARMPRALCFGSSAVAWVLMIAGGALAGAGGGILAAMLGTGAGPGAFQRGIGPFASPEETTLWSLALAGGLIGLCAGALLGAMLHRRLRRAARPHKGPAHDIGR